MIKPVKSMIDLDELVRREVSVMAVSGWRLYQRWPGGADFTTGGNGSGISTGVHLILLVLTFGLWLPIMIVVELASSGGAKFCRLTFTPEGEPRYQTIKRRDTR